MSTELPRATSTLQEVGLLLLWLIFTLRAVWLCLALRGVFGWILNYGKLPYLDPTHYPDFRTGFRVGNKGNLACVLQVNCSHISERDVRLLNYPNRTSITQVMVRLPGTT